MKRSLVLTLALLVAPALVSAQAEVGLDAGFTISSIQDVNDNVNSFALPGQWARVGFSAGETLMVESLIGFDWSSQGDYSSSTLLLMPGLNLLFAEKFYVRGEAGLLRLSVSDTGFDASSTQYGFGGAVGLRNMLGDAAVLRLEAGVDRWLENTDDGVPARTDIRIGAGISAVIN